MRKFIIKQELRIMEMADRAKRYSKDKANQAMELAFNKDGATLTTEQLIWILGIATVAIIVIVGVIAFINGDFFPAFKTKVMSILDLK